MEIVERRPRPSTTEQVVINNRRDRRQMSELMLGIVGHNAMGLQRGLKVLRRYLLFLLALEVDRKALSASMNATLVSIVWATSLVSPDTPNPVVLAA
jgi:hypothetical protein